MCTSSEFWVSPDTERSHCTYKREVRMYIDTSSNGISPMKVKTMYPMVPLIKAISFNI